MRRFVNDVEMGPRVSSFSPHAAIKHHGLYNQGATCYLNSVLQVLFMTKDFREAVERNPCENGDDYIDHQLKTLFHVLKDNTAETRNITRKLGIHRVYEQRDAAEHFDQILSLTSPEASKIFSGLLTHQSECSGCHILTETDGQFWHLPLALVDPCSKCYSVVDGIKEFFKVSFITGENQLFCDHCDAKADATVKCVVKHHPEVLMLLLKRFEFNYRYMTYVKNNCVVDVPYTLQIPENQTYELYAVVDHYGDLRGGHYTATVKSQDDERWYNFNDTRVTLLDYQIFQVDHTERSQSVYLLFYRKNQNARTQDMRGVSTSGHFSPAASNHDDQKIRERERSGEKRKKKKKNKKKPEDDWGVTSVYTIDPTCKSATGTTWKGEVERHVHEMKRFKMNECDQHFRTSEAAAIKHHGLYNQGATCYLNSVLQVLFMTKDFREAVERNPCEKGDDYIDHQLKTLFHVLKDKTAETHNITRKLGIHRVYEQRDAAEHFDQILSLTSPEASKIFSGLLTHQSKCSGCHILTETDGPFWHLPLALVDPCSKHYSVVDGIKEFFKVSFITGENQLFCDHCDAKADATVKCVVKHHPEVLMLLLKRFEFNYRYMTYVKNNCVVDVPYTLQIPENQTYELYAVVDHYGDLRGGHYTATVKSQDDERWYNFNDTRVTLLDYQTFQVDHTESSTRSQSVYLLFYRKNQNACTRDMRGVSTSGHFSPAASNHDDQKIRERERSGEKRKKKNKNKNKKRPEDDWGCKHGGSNRLYKGHEQQREERRDDKGHKEQERGDDEPAQRKETFTTKPYLSEGVEDQDKRRFEGVRQNKPEQEVSVTHTTSKNVGEEKQAEEQENKEDEPIQSKETKRRAELAERGRLTENQGAQSAKRTRLEDSQKKKENSQTKHLNRAAECQDSERLDNVKNNINEDEGHKQEVGQDYSLQTVGVDKTGDEEKMELDVKDDEEGKTGADKVTSGKRQQLTQSGLYTDGLQNDGSVGESKKNEPEDDEGCKHGGSNRLYKGHEQQREERRDDKGQKEQERGDDEPAQRKETFTTKPYLSEGVEDQDKRRFEGVRQNRPEQEISVTHTTSRGRLTENQGAQSAEIIETLQETSQPHIRNQVKNERSPDRKSDPKTDVGNSQRNGKKKKNWKIRGCPQCLKSKTKD